MLLWSQTIRLFGRRIKNTRKGKAITQEELAEKLEISTIFLSKIERGVTPINLKRIMEIAAILEVRISVLLEGSAIGCIDSSKYVTQEFGEILKKCNQKQQRFIYEVAELVVEMNL